MNSNVPDDIRDATLLEGHVIERDNTKLQTIVCPECHNTLIQLKFSPNGFIRSIRVLCKNCLSQGKLIEAVGGPYMENIPK